MEQDPLVSAATVSSDLLAEHLLLTLSYKPSQLAVQFQLCKGMVLFRKVGSILSKLFNCCLVKRYGHLNFACYLMPEQNIKRFQIPMAFSLAWKNRISEIKQCLLLKVTITF